MQNRGGKNGVFSSNEKNVKWFTTLFITFDRQNIFVFLIVLYLVFFFSFTNLLVMESEKCMYCSVASSCTILKFPPRATEWRMGECFVNILVLFSRTIDRLNALNFNISCINQLSILVSLVLLLL